MSNKNNFFSIANNLENLEKNKGYLIWIRCGAFFVAICANAVILSNILGLKRICIKQGVCKVGIPVNSLEKYKELLDKTKYAYVIYDYDREKTELKEICSKVGKLNKNTDKNINCLICKGIDKYKEDEYMEAISKLIEKEKEYGK